MAKKMKLISEDMYNTLVKAGQDSNTALNNSDMSAKQLLNSDIPDDIKLALYMQLIKEFNQNVSRLLTAQITQPSHNTSTVIPDSEEKNGIVNLSNDTGCLDESVINEFFPERYRSNAKYIVKLLKTRPDLISWNTKFEVTFLSDDYCNGSSILDLISYLIRDLKWDLAPKGSNRFLLVCKLLNIPISMVRKGLRTKMSAEMEDMTSMKSASDSTTDFPELKNRFINWTSLEDEFFTDDDEK